MKNVLFIFVILTFLSCKTEEDKYPNMPVFAPDMRGDFVFEEIEAPSIYYRDTKEYVFFQTPHNTPDDKLTIYKKETKQRLKTISVANRFVSIDDNSTIYGFDEEKQKAFKYQAPNFTKIDLETVSLDYVSYKNLEEKYASEIKDENLEGRPLYDFLEEKRYRIFKEKIINPYRPSDFRL